MQYNCDHLFITEKLAKRFMNLKSFNYYNDTDSENLLFNIISKILDNDYIANDKLIENKNMSMVYLLFYEDINYKRDNYFNVQRNKILNYYKKKHKKNEECFYSIDETIKRIAYKKSGAIDKKICFTICQKIINDKAQSSFAELFILICKFVFSFDFDKNVILYDYYLEDSFSRTQFTILKSEIAKTIENYNKKINKEEQND